MRKLLTLAALAVLLLFNPDDALSQWSFERDRDEMTDEAVVYLSTRALSSVRTSYRTIRPSLYVRCNAGSLAVFFQVGGATDDEVLEYRFDDGPVERLEMSASTDYDALFVPSYNFGGPNEREFL